jgi:hypothetical protein|tara:strand:- start:22 stop:234 length:213 start_codon:yes stop_codon:yes gene_type:complete
MSKWKNTDNSSVTEKLKDTEIGSLINKLQALQGYLEDQLKRDQDAIIRSELEIEKVISQNQSREVKDDRD